MDAVARPDTLIVVDGYHGYMALPTDLAAIEARAFYLSGGYKYAMAGEGVAFLHAPPGLVPRPRDTGWYAAFEALEAPNTTGDPNAVAYPASWGRYRDRRDVGALAGRPVRLRASDHHRRRRQPSAMLRREQVQGPQRL